MKLPIQIKPDLIRFYKLNQSVTPQAKTRIATKTVNLRLTKGLTYLDVL
jgi:hypothetical protein